MTRLLLILLFSSFAFGKQITPNTMAPLAVGDIKNPNAASEKSAWDEFEKQLDEAKSMGIYAITTDVWWGVVEAVEGTFEWEYYDKLAALIEKKKLKWVPILSIHRCGGNIGDSCNFPIPKWIWTKYVGQSGVPNADALKYKSEYGHLSDEVVSVWGTSTVLKDYEKFFEEFQKHFKAYASNISEINISLGASGELRYPSFNSHDPKAGYPSRGALQSYSDLAIGKFREAIKTKYKTIKALNAAWGFGLSDWNRIYPPSNLGPPDASKGFFASREHYSQYGKDFFDWYQESLLSHGEKILKKAVEIFDGKSSAFRGIDIGAKIPGVHWRSSSDRLAELAGGMIRTSGPALNEDTSGHGYSHLISLFKRISKLTSASNLQLHYTCLEKSNGEDGTWASSVAKNLVFWVGAEANRQGVSIRGENALAGPLASSGAWDNMEDALHWSYYTGLTILRIANVTDNPLANKRYRQLISKF